MTTGTNDTVISSNDSLHNITGKGVNSTLEPSAETEGKSKLSTTSRDAHGHLLPGSILNPEGKNQSLQQILREKGDKPCAYVPGMTWAQALIENEWSQALNDPIARKHLLDRLMGRATESVNLNQSGVVTLRVVHDDYVNPNEAKQLENNLTITSPDNNSAPLDTE
jgi:hypothetical protein